MRAVEATRLFMIANLGRYIPGKVWQIAGLAALAKSRGVPAATATGAAVLGQGIALVAATAVGTGALLGGPEALRPWGVVAISIMALVAMLTAVPVVFQALAKVGFRLARSEPPETLGAVRGLQWLLLYVLNWVAYALSFWLMVVSFGASAPLVPVASAFAAAYVLGYLMIFAPAGVGVREGFLIAFLTPQLGVGPAGVLAIVARIWTTLVEVVPAAVFWFGFAAGDSDDGGATRE